MIDQKALQQDFFIYVPGASELVRPARGGGESTLCATIPPADDSWVRIPVTEELVIYARMLPEEECVLC